nr:hypothetical protein [Tanacetum cinerariifolium]
ALGFQNPCYLKKAQQLKPKLYDGSVIEKSDAIVILDTEETLLLAEESRSKMIEKQNDPKVTKKKVITKPIDYAIINQLSTNFETRFVPQTELSIEQAFWSQYSVQTDEPNLSANTTIVEVPKELPKVSMVNSCLKKLKFHLVSFDMVVKERTTATAITEGTWGFKHTKSCFRDDVIPFVKALKELFTSFDQCLIDEVTEVQNVFKQMELAVEQHYCDEINSAKIALMANLSHYGFDNLAEINQDNKHVNDLLTAKLERYRSQERVLNELKHDKKASTSYESSQEIESLKHTLSEHLKEKESLEQKITILKNDFQKEESRNINRELALEKQVKELNKIVFKRSQSAQTVHMLTKPQVFYNPSTRQALGFQNPCYLKKAQQLKPKLYDGRIIKKSDAVMIPDTEETLMLAEKSRSKVIEKQKDPQMTEKKVITKPINYAILNQLSTYFKTRFVPQIELSAEQAFWSKYSVQTDEPNLFATTTIVEVPKELPKVSMGTWGFEHTKACFRDDIIPFVKALKELFTSFDQYLIDEVTEVQNVFKQIELAIEQHREEKHKFQNKMEHVLQENDRILTQALSVEIVNVVVHDNVMFDCLNVDVCAHCVTIESELKKDFIKKECYETLLQQYHNLEKHCISLKVNNQLKKEIFQKNTLSSSESAPTFAEFFEINELKAQAQAKDTVILQLKEKLRSLKGDVIERSVKREVEEIETLNIELDHK